MKSSSEISALIAAFKQKNNLTFKDPVSSELGHILHILNYKKIITVEDLFKKGPALLVKAYPGLSVNRINLLYEVIGEEPPFEYVKDFRVRVKDKLVLKEKYR